MTSHPLLITYMNAGARAVLTRLHVLDGSLGMPNEIMTFCLDLLEALDDRSDMNMWTPFELEREVSIAGTWICLRGLGLPRSLEIDDSRICILMEERNLNGKVLLLSREGEITTLQQPSRSEDLVLQALQINEALSLEQITERVPDLSWNDLFHAVDRLSRRGDLVLQRRGFAYYVSLPRMSCLPA